MSEFFFFLQKRQELEWATAYFSSLSHDTMDCIVTQGTGASSKGATILPKGPTTQPHDTAAKGHDTAGLRAGASGAHACGWPDHRVSCDTKFVSWLGATFVSQYGTARLRYSVATCATALETRCAAGACVAIQTLYRDRGACDTANCARGMAYDTASACCNTD